MCWNPSDLNFPSHVPKLVECLNDLDEDVLARRALRISDAPDSSLVVREGDALARSVRNGVDVEENLKRQLHPSKLLRIYRGGS